MIRTLAATLFVWSLSTTLASAQLIVGNDQTGTATIYNIDVTSGIATPIYSSSATDAKPWGMAYDAANNFLYWNNGSTLFRSPFGAVLTPTNLGTMTFNAATVNFVSLSFSNGTLFGTRNIATEAVYEINTTTLVASQVYVYPSAFDFGGLDHDASTGLLYGLTDSNTAGLYEINVPGQTQTFRAPYPGGETDIDGLAVNNGKAYYVTDGPNTTQANFYVFDIASGTQIGTLPSPFTGSGTFSAATFVAAVPEPTTVVLMGATVLAGLGLAYRQKRLRTALNRLRFKRYK